MKLSIYQRILMIVVAILVPVALALGAVRLVLNDWYIQFEYHTPGFPADPFGFTLEDRLRYAHQALAYLTNSANISFLGDLRFPPGQTAPQVSCLQMTDCNKLYNERELSHMLDVKKTVQGSIRVWYGSLALLLVFGIVAWFLDARTVYFKALQYGSWLTLILLALIILFVLGAFDIIFVAFHEIFFAAGTWTFYTSDTLIRLFPERFWRDTFLMVGGLTVAFAIIIAIAARQIEKRLKLLI